MNRMPTAFTIKLMEPKIRIGVWLRQEREARGWTLEKASRETKILPKYLRAIEDEHFEELPEGLVRRNFIRGYLQILGGESEFLHQIEMLIQPEVQARVHPVHPPLGLRAGLFPLDWRILATVLAVLGLVVYLGYEVWMLASPPILNLADPVRDAATVTPIIRVSGSTDPRAIVLVNDRSVPKDRAGNFETTVDLEGGVNVIKVQAKKKYSRPRVEYRMVLFESPTSQ